MPCIVGRLGGHSMQGMNLFGQQISIQIEGVVRRIQSSRFERMLPRLIHAPLCGCSEHAINVEFIFGMFVGVYCKQEIGETLHVGFEFVFVGGRVAFR